MSQSEQSLTARAAVINTVEEYIEWERQCDDFIEALRTEARVKRIRLRLGYNQWVEAQILRLEGLKHKTSQSFIHTGAGNNSDSELIWRETKSAFERRVTTGAIINQSHIDPRLFLMDAGEIAIKKVQEAIHQHNCVKVNTLFTGEFAVGDKQAYKSINTRNCEFLRTTDLNAWYEEQVVEPTLAKLEEFQDQDSGWSLQHILNLTLNINKYRPMSAGCRVTLPRDIRLKKAVVNVQSRDNNACFAWAVIAALYPAETHSDRVSSYPDYRTILKFTGISFPVELNKVKKFKILNNLSINVYGLQKSVVVPIHITAEKKDRHINLLYLEGSGDDQVGHYSWIKNLSRLVNSNLNKHRAGKHICDR